MKSTEIRSRFVEYFKKHNHAHLASSRLIPDDDPTLLFTNAGMNQFKNVFLGLDKRDYRRAVTYQKCVRAGGKHNDLENVGHTARHHTFFEMLGNFSFGDYFKKEAIHFAWELLTRDFGLPKERLYVTVYESDDQAAEIWHKQEGIPKDRIFRLSEKDNFWRMGDTGPCGPCSEIFYDLGPEVGGDPKDNVMGGSGDRYMEIWNLVFMQFHEDGSRRNPLPNPSIDTGAGLERMASVLQGEISNYHTDLFVPLIERACRTAGVEYVKDLKPLKEKTRKDVEKINVALRVLADHARAAAFLIADGVLPSNEGRGYVLRRIMRRAIRYGRSLSETKGLYPGVVEEVIQTMSAIFPELQQQKAVILHSVRDEESRFLTTLDQGTHILAEALGRVPTGGILTGEVAFKLYDTFGFPLDLTRLMAAEQGFKTDEAGFEQLMEKAREKARASWKGKGLTQNAAHLIQWSQQTEKTVGSTEFIGYQGTSCQSDLVALSDGQQQQSVLKKDATGLMVFKKTCFYAESGGQVGDVGRIRGPHGEAEVLDCTSHNGVSVHHVRIVDGSISVGETCHLQVLDLGRRQTACNHSATHLMHAALRTILGPHVTQAGSLVEPQRLRFDFTHNKPLSPEEIRRVEHLVNSEISKANTVSTQVMAPQKAIEQGAMALFGEKYGDQVRVIKMGDFSTELCGGTHVENTSWIRLFKIVSEGGVSAGVRRIEALTGDLALEYLLRLAEENLEVRSLAGLQENWTKSLEEPTSLVDWVQKSREDVKGLQRQIQSLKGQKVDLDGLVKQAKSITTPLGAAHLLFTQVDSDDREVLSQMSDRLRDKLESAVVVLVGQGTDSYPLVVNVSKNLMKIFGAGQLLRELASKMDGKGGGRPDFAQGAVKNLKAIPEAERWLIGHLGEK